MKLGKSFCLKAKDKITNFLITSDTVLFMLILTSPYPCLPFSAPQEGEHHHQSSKNLAELQARKNAIDIVAAICRTASDLLHRAQSVPPENVKETLVNAQLFKSLLPLCVAYIGPVASQDPRVGGEAGIDAECSVCL